MRDVLIRRTIGAVLALVLAPLALGDAVAIAPQDPGEQPPAPQMSDAASAALDAAIDGTREQGLELKVLPHFFPSQQGGTLTMVAFETATDGLEFTTAEATPDGTTPPATADLEAFAAVLRDGEEVSRFGGPFTIEEGAGEDGFSATHSFGATLEPGDYELIWGVRDLDGGITGTSAETVQVPAFGTGELQITSVLMSAGVTQTREPMLPGAVFPGVRVATLLVDDDLDRVFEPTQQVELIYLVIGAQPGPVPVSLRVSYPGEFSGTYSLTQADGSVVEESVSGSGEGEWSISGSSVSASFQKQAAEGTLTVELVQGDQVVRSASTDAESDTASIPESDISSPPSGGPPQIENSYRILDDEGNSLVRFPPQQINRITVGQPIPLARIDSLEAGASYRFEVVAEDLVADIQTRKTVPFSIAGEAPSSEED